MFTVKPDGSIQCDTAKEALELQAEIVGKTAPAVEPVIRPRLNGSPPPTRKVATKDDIEFLTKLSAHAGKELSAVDLAPLLGADGAAGAGPKLNWTSQRLE